MEDPIQAEIILYQSEGANVPVQVYYKDETLWVSQAAMAELFDVSVSTISEHLVNIFASGELQKASSTSFSGFSGKPPQRAADRKPTTISMPLSPSGTVSTRCARPASANGRRLP